MQKENFIQHVLLSITGAHFPFATFFQRRMSLRQQDLSSLEASWGWWKYFSIPHQWLMLAAQIPQRPSPPWFYCFHYLPLSLSYFWFFFGQIFFNSYEVIPCKIMAAIRGHWKWPNLIHTHKLKTKINKSGSNRRSIRVRYNIVVKKVSFPLKVICWRY